MRLWERTKTGGKMIDESLKIIGTYQLHEVDCLPCRAVPVFIGKQGLCLRRFEDGNDFELVSMTDLVEGKFFDLILAKENHCLLQVGENSFEYIAEENLERRLAEIGIEAVKNAKSFLDEGKEDEAEKLLWYAARAMPKSASVLVLLRIVLKEKISEEEMKVLDRKIQELTVV